MTEQSGVMPQLLFLCYILFISFLYTNAVLLYIIIANAAS